MTIIVPVRERTVDKILDATVRPLRNHLPDALIEEQCRLVKYEWRNRVYSPVVTVLVCLWKHFQSGQVSVRASEDYVKSLIGVPAFPQRRDGKDFCKARARLPLAVFRATAEHVGVLAHKSGALVYQGLRVVLIDGTTVRTANTKALERAFGRSRNAVRESRSPLMRLLLLVCAGCGSVLQVAIGAYAVSEKALFMQMLGQLAPGTLLVADRGFASFVLLALSRQRQTHFVVRVSTRMLTASKRKLGYRDDVREWRRPSPSQTVFADKLEALPESMDVRVIERAVRRAGYRTWTLRIATSLLDADVYSADDLVELYLKRWDIELTIRTLKTHEHMARLTGKTPDIAQKEIQCVVLAHNCVCAMMAQSGEAPELVSSKRAREIIQSYAGYMAFAPAVTLPKLFNEMVLLIATAVQMPQPRGPEPRAIVQRPSTFPVLMTPRSEWKSKARKA